MLANAQHLTSTPVSANTTVTELLFALKITTELILERAGPAILKILFTGINNFPIASSNLSCEIQQEEQSLNISGSTIFIPDSAYPAIKSAILQKFLPEDMFPDPLLFWS